MKAKDLVTFMQTGMQYQDDTYTLKVGCFLCTRGTADIVFDNEHFHIEPHTLMMLYPNAQIHVLHHSDDWSGRIEIDNVEAYYPTLDIIDARSRVLIRNQRCIHISEAEAQRLLRLSDLINTSVTDVHPEKAPLSVLDKLGTERLRFLRSTLLIEIALLFLSHQPGEQLVCSPHEGIVNNFLGQMLRDCHTERTVAYYADLQHLSPYYFSTIIRESTGKTPLQWITMFTINLSKHYLTDTEMSIKEIADTLHFPDQSTFGRYFKHHMGCSPGEYRKGVKF